LHHNRAADGGSLDAHKVARLALAQVTHGRSESFAHIPDDNVAEAGLRAQHRRSWFGAKPVDVYRAFGAKHGEVDIVSSVSEGDVAVDSTAAVHLPTIETNDGNIADIAARQVGVECTGERQRVAVAVDHAQHDGKRARSEQDFELQTTAMRPAFPLVVGDVKGERRFESPPRPLSSPDRTGTTARCRRLFATTRRDHR
jgi:hypothetical protein